jgi:hypothetical protein
MLMNLVSSLHENIQNWKVGSQSCYMESVKHKSLITQRKENTSFGSFVNKSAASSSQPLSINQAVTNITNSGCVTSATTIMKETENTSQVQLTFGRNDTLKAEIIWAGIHKDSKNFPRYYT